MVTKPKPFDRPELRSEMMAFSTLHKHRMHPLILDHLWTKVDYLHIFPLLFVSFVKPIRLYLKYYPSLLYCVSAELKLIQGKKIIPYWNRDKDQ